MGLDLEFSPDPTHILKTQRPSIHLQPGYSDLLS